MNNLYSFLALRAAIFLAVTALLILLSRLEANLTDVEMDPGSRPAHHPVQVDL